MKQSFPDDDQQNYENLNFQGGIRIINNKEKSISTVVTEQ